MKPATSIKTYRKISQAGLQKAHHRKIVEALTEHGPMNYREIAKKARIEPAAVDRRTDELIKAGKIQVVGESQTTTFGRGRVYEAVKQDQ